MSCCNTCENIYNFGCINPCHLLYTGIVASKTGEYRFEFDYNDKVVPKTTDIASGNEIVIDLEDLNENYEFLFVVFDPDGERLIATIEGETVDCFQLTTKVGATQTKSQLDPVPGMVLQNAILSPYDEQWTPLNTLANGNLASLNQLSVNPIALSRIVVIVNGREHKVGNGVKTNCSCYFSDDNGISPKTYTDITTGDKLYWNPSFAGFNLESTDELHINYLTTDQP